MAAEPERVACSLVEPFYRAGEEMLPPDSRVYHNHLACQTARSIPFAERRRGTNSSRLCAMCLALVQARIG